MSYMKQNFVDTNKVERLINHLKTTTHRFEMAHWDFCACGHIAWMQGHSLGSLTGDPVVWGAKQLGISLDAAQDLFCNWPRDEKMITKAALIWCLRILRDEGVVDWDRAYALAG